MSPMSKRLSRADRRPPTLKDVAERAGVSIMAVSVVVNGTKSTVGVSEATRVRIQQALDDLQYQPNTFARSLRMQRTGTVGYYSGIGYINPTDPYMRTIFQGVAKGLQEHGQDILIYNPASKDRHEALAERMLSQKVDAVIVLAGDEDVVLLDALRRAPLPAILVADAMPGLKTITTDDAGGATALARHLCEKGHRRILFRRASRQSRSEANRYEAFRAVVEQAGGAVISCKSADTMETVTSEEEDVIRDRSAGGRVTAIACWRDYSAVRVYDYCVSKGMHVPGDIAIAGFDGIPDPTVLTGLTTVDAHWDLVARGATDLVRQILSGQDVPETTIIPATLKLGVTA